MFNEYKGDCHIKDWNFLTKESNQDMHLQNIINRMNYFIFGNIRIS